MKTTCLINNYNYEDYVVEAVNSALKQSVPFDEIIIVDDASTDSSPFLLKEKFGHHPQIKLILNHQNSGQLNAFNQGYLAATSDLIFFLDSDDLYAETYLEEALKVYNNDPKCSFLFCQTEVFGHSQGTFVYYKSKHNKPVYNLGYSVVSTLYASAKVGASTSAISMKKEILDQFMPIPFTDACRISADQFLNWGSSLVGAKKYYLKNSLVKYRVHSCNNWFNNAHYQESEPRYINLLAKNRFLNFVINRMQYSNRLYELASSEFETIPEPTFSQLRAYLKLVLMRNEINFLKKINLSSKIFKHYMSSTTH